MAACEEGGLDDSRVKSCKSSAVINGVDTDIACYSFENRIFIILTQFKRPGTIVSIPRPAIAEAAGYPESLHLNINKRATLT